MIYYIISVDNTICDRPINRTKMMNRLDRLIYSSVAASATATMLSFKNASVGALLANTPGRKRTVIIRYKRITL